MPRSIRPAGASAGQSAHQGPPSPGNPEYNGQTGQGNGSFGPNVRGGRDLDAGPRNNGGPGANSPMSSEFAQLMEEPAGGDSHGRRASDNPNVEGRHLALDADSWQAAEFMRGGGWSVISMGGGERQRSGMNAHRGVLHPEEHVDADVLRGMVEAELGFSYEQVRSVYRRGRLSAATRELRGRIDARVLALSRSGANIALLGRALGFHVNESGACEALNNALARARKEEL